MGFFDKLKEKKVIKSTAKIFSKVHPDLIDLLYIAMYSPSSFPDKFNTKHEPSTIYFDLPILQPDEFVCVQSPEYWPCYYELTAEQRYKYFEFLYNPYGGDHDIGYVFLLFYGLERQLEEGNCEKAFRVILKLRDVYNHKSFQKYSLESLISFCIEKKKIEMFCELMERCQLQENICAEFNLAMLAKSFLKIPFTAKDLIENRKQFGDTSKNLPDNPYEYEKVVQENMNNIFGTSELEIKSYIYQDTKLYSIPRYQNLSLNHLLISIPNLAGSNDFSSKCELVLFESRNHYKKTTSKKKEEITYTHGDLILNEREEIFYKHLIDAFKNVWSKEEFSVVRFRDRLEVKDQYGTIGMIKLTGRKFKMNILEIIIECQFNMKYYNYNNIWIDIESTEHAISKIEDWVKMAKERKNFHIELDEAVERERKRR